MATRKARPTTEVYQLKISLKGSRPLIWRRVQVTGDIALSGLHHIIQTAMGWDTGHLHVFTINGVDYGEMDMPEIPDWEDEELVEFRQVAAAGVRRFRYEYDLGDSWQHEITIEKILPLDPAVRYPVCLKGENACPPEDCGGIGGYYDMLAALADPDDPEHEHYLEWLGDEFDPEAFDLEAANRTLRDESRVTR